MERVLDHLTDESLRAKVAAGDMRRASELLLEIPAERRFQATMEAQRQMNMIPGEVWSSCISSAVQAIKAGTAPAEYECIGSRH